MSWRKYFKSANTRGQYSPLSSRGGRKSGEDAVGVLNYPNLLQESYLGCPNRIERYQNFESMDQDSEINAALDILAEFSTQNDDQTQMCFDLDIKDELTESEIKIIKERLKSWYHLNELNKRSFRLFRNVLKYGDQVFLRDPETFKLFYMEMDNVIKVIVNESEGKKPEQYIVRNIMPNFENLTVTQVSSNNLYNVIPSGPGFTAQSAGFNMPNNPYSSSSRFSHGQNEHAIDAQHVMHLSLTEGLDPNWPFGTSILENVFKVFKQKELLEDSIIIYRVQRAPERRVFKIDVGDMPSHLAMAFIDKVKNEIHQRRIPSFGEGRQFQDTTYFSLAPNADFFFPVTSCISLDEKVKLLNGKSLTLQEIIDEYNAGITNWVYSVNPDTKLVEPGEIIWAGVTRKNAQIVKVTLDDGSSVKVTPDHRFIMRDGSEKEAQYLLNGDRIMPLYLKNTKTSKYQGEAKYPRFICPATGNFKWVHTMACPKTMEGKSRVIHHIDCNSLNNNPDNLIEMDSKEHSELHRKIGSYNLMSAWKDPSRRKKIVDGIRSYHANATAEDKQMMFERVKTNSAFMDRMYNPEIKSAIAKNFSATPKESFKKAARRAARQTAARRKVIYTPEMANRMIELFHDGHNTLDKMFSALRYDSIFQLQFREANPNIKRNINEPAEFCPYDKAIQAMSRMAGYASWGAFVKTYKFNHIIQSVEWLSKTMDTGDLTIKSRNNCHNFALDIGIFVHNSGRGSSVEQLPGGCLAMDTTVPLLDGRTLTIEELANEFNEGKQNWVYSCNPENGDIVPGLISWAGVTQKSATVLRITLDNGEVITATPDHKFPILEKGFVEASDLKVNDRLIPFNAKQQKISKTSGKYTQVYNPLTKEWEYVHRLVNKYFERNSKIKSAHLLLRNTPEFKEKQKIFMQSQQVKVDKKVIDLIQSMVIANSTITLNAIVNKINSTNEILNHFLNINSNTRCANWNNDRITVSQIKTAVKRNGYKTWKQFKKEATLYNHSIISIEYLPEPIEVGTLTIDKDETYHNYHTFALSSGVFTKNSNLDEIKDLLYFNNKMIRALRIPSSYLPTGPDESERTLSDGKVGTALIQEFRFNQYCQRLQRLICGPLDLEFKAYMKWSGVNIDSSSFELTFNPPQNFAHYRQAELDAAKVGTFQSLEALPYMSKRFLMKRFLGLSEDELVENSKLWREEQVDKIESESNNPDFRSLGITPGGVQSDIDNFGSAAMPSMGPEGGAPPPEAGAGTAPPPPGGEAPPAPTV